MSPLLADAVTGIIAFTATNVDGFVVLVALFARDGGGLRTRHIVAGQYLGFSSILLASSPAVWLGGVVRAEWIGLLGLLPIALGVMRWVGRPRSDAPAPPAADLARTPAPLTLRSVLSPQTAAVAMLTLANGGDNIAVYMPVLMGSSPSRTCVILTVFLVLCGAWCSAARRVARHPLLAAWLARHGTRAVPILLIAIGVYRLLDSGTLPWLLGR